MPEKKEHQAILVAPTENWGAEIAAAVYRVSFIDAKYNLYLDSRAGPKAFIKDPLIDELYQKHGGIPQFVMSKEDLDASLEIIFSGGGLLRYENFVKETIAKAPNTTDILESAKQFEAPGFKEAFFDKVVDYVRSKQYSPSRPEATIPCPDPQIPRQ